MSPAVDRERILVTGAAGAQGSSVARHLLARGRFAVRALTRDPRSGSACELRQTGAEVIQGDLADRASLRAALKRCYGAFGVTPAGEPVEEARRHAMNLVNAIAGSEVDHFVFSTPPYLDLEAELEGYARSLGIPATFLHVAAGAAEEVGGVVAAAFESPARFLGKVVQVAGGPVSIQFTSTF